VVIVHKEQAQTFRDDLDEVIPQHHFEGTQVKHMRSGGNKNPSLQRQEENRVKATWRSVWRIIDREGAPSTYKGVCTCRPGRSGVQSWRSFASSLKKIITGRCRRSLDRSVGELEVDIRKPAER